MRTRWSLPVLRTVYLRASFFWRVAPRERLQRRSGDAYISPSKWRPRDPGPRVHIRWRAALAALTIGFGCPLSGCTARTQAGTVAVRRAPRQAMRLGLALSTEPHFRPICARARSGAVPVIMYHDVTPKRQVWFDVTTAEFRQQMDLLRRKGLAPVSLEALKDYLTMGAPLPRRAILLTFDDGYLGNWTEAAPILREYRFPAAFFVHTDNVGTVTVKRHMSWDQLRALDRQGFEIGSETCSHPEDLTRLSDTQLLHEICDSRATLQAHLGHPIWALAYPQGHFDRRVIARAHACGYVMAFGENRGMVNRSPSILGLNRFAPKRFREAVALAR